MAVNNESIKLRLLTVNTHKGFTYFNRKFVLPELREAVRTVSADLVFMQEVIGARRVVGRRHHKNWERTPHYEFLADSIWHNYAYGRNAVYPEGHHGNALMSKYPITWYRNVDVTVGNMERRGLLHCYLQRPEDSRGVHAVCVHLGLKNSHRMHQLALLADLVKDIPKEEAVIVAGDFNDWLGKAGAVLSNSGLEDVYEKDFGMPPRTFPAIWPLLRLDRIYVRGVRHCSPILLPNRPWAHLSDHAPLAAEVVL